MDQQHPAPSTNDASSTPPAPAVPTATSTFAVLKRGTRDGVAFAAAQEAWGKPNGGVYKKQNGVKVPYLRVRQPRYEYIVMVRDVYADIYAWVAAQMETMRAAHAADGSSPATRLVLYGHPVPGQPVFYHHLGSDKVYLFNGTHSEKMSFSEFTNIRPKIPVVCLVDTPAMAYTGQSDEMWRKRNTLFVLASSPRQTPDKALEKAQGATYYYTMPAAGLEEVENLELLRQHLKLAGHLYNTTETIQLHRHKPSPACTAGRAFNLKEACVRIASSAQRFDEDPAPSAQEATNAPPDDQEKEEKDSPRAVVISIGRDCFDVSTEPDWTPRELFQLLGPSFRLAFDRTLKKGKNPEASLRLFFKLASAKNDDSLEKISTILEGARLDLRERPSGYHQIVYEVPSGDQPSAGDPMFERVIPTRFLFAIIREQVQHLQRSMLKAVIVKLLPFPLARRILYETCGIHCIGTLDSPLKVHAASTAPESSAHAFPSLPKNLPCASWEKEQPIPCKNGIYVAPVRYTTLDGFVISDADSDSPNLFLLQFTIAARHAVKADGIAGLLCNISWTTIPDVYFVFVVPDEETGRTLAQGKYPGLGGHSIGASTDPDDGPAKKKLKTKIDIRRGYAVIPLADITTRLEQLFPRHSPQAPSISAFSHAYDTSP